MNKTSVFKSTAFGLALASFLSSGTAQTWIADSNGDWSDALNWLGGTPADGIDAIADFSTIDISGHRIVTLDSNRTLGHLKFGDLLGAQNWTLNTNASGDSILTVATSSDLPTITVSNNGVTNRVSLAGTQGFVKLGSGWLTLQGTPPNTFSGTAVVSNGIVYLNKPAGTNAISGDLEIHSDAIVAYTSANDQIADSSTVTIHEGGMLNLNNRSDTIHTLVLDGGVLTNNSGSPSLQTTSGFDIRSGKAYSVLAGAGKSLIKTTAGKAILSANNSFTGSVLIEAGTLQIGNGGTTGTPGGSGILITNHGELVFNRGSGSTLTISGVISGSGSVTKTGPGTVALTGANTYSGDTTISNGTINISSSSTLGNGSGTLILAGGTLNTTANRSPSTAPVSNPIHITADSAITTSSSAGTVELNFTSSSITGSAGTLTFRNDGADAATDSFEPRFSGAVTIDRPIVIDSGSTGQTRLNLFNTNGTTQTFNAAITGSGSVRKSIASGTGGVTIFNAANTYSGTTLIASGTLLVNGELGTNTVTVSSGATLGGTGIVHGAVQVQSGGMLSPGTSIGTLSINNSLTLAAGSKTLIDIDATDSTSDRVDGLSSVEFDGTLQLNITGTLSAGQSFQLFSAGAYSGKFSSIIPETPGEGLIWNTNALALGVLAVVSENGVQQPAITDLVRLGDRNFQFSFSGTAGQGFSVWGCTNLSSGADWILLTNSSFGTDPFVFIDLQATNYPQRFYRVSLP